MVEVIRDPQRAKDWKKVLEQELRTGNVDGVDFSHFYDGFTAATDSPSSVCFPRLLALNRAELVFGSLGLLLRDLQTVSRLQDHPDTPRPRCLAQQLYRSDAKAAP